MSEEMMNTKEVAQYLGIHEKQVYMLIKEKKVPATRITGKWVFPKKMIDEWIASSARKALGEARTKGKRIEGALLAAGSNDPILDILQTHIRKMHPEFYIFSANTGSTEGLKALDKGYTDIAWSHLFDPETGAYNLPFLPSYLPNINPVVVNLFSPGAGFYRGAGESTRYQDICQPGRKRCKVHQPAARRRNESASRLSP